MRILGLFVKIEMRKDFCLFNGSSVGHRNVLLHACNNAAFLVVL